MFLSSGSTAAELNKVTSNLCLQPPSWGESPASWHSRAEHIHFPWQAGILAGAQRPAGCRANLPQRPRPPSSGSQALCTAFQTGHWLRHCISSAWNFPGSHCGSLKIKNASAGCRTTGWPATLGVNTGPFPLLIFPFSQAPGQWHKEKFL